MEEKVVVLEIRLVWWV